MLDQILIFTRCGVILWSKTFCKLKDNPIEEFISTIIIPEKGSENFASIGTYALKWVLSNTHGIDLIFVVVYSKLLTLLYLDELLSHVKQAFLTKFDTQLDPSSYQSVYDFDEEYDRLALQAETKHMQEKQLKNRGIIKSEFQNKKTDSSNSMNETLMIPEEPGDSKDAADESQQRTSPNKIQEKKPESKKSQKRQKEDRVWSGGGGGKLSSKQVAALDRSGQIETKESKEQREIEQTKAIYLPSEGERPLWEIEQEESSRLEEVLKNDSASLSSGIWKSLQSSYIGSMIQTITGGKILEESDLQPVLEEMKELLQSKNVAQEIADDICSSVGQALIGHRLASFTGIKNVVLEALHTAVQRILTPGTSVDVLRQVLDAKASGKIFSIVFVGINGVGKSTSLAKIAYYLDQHGIKVLLAACDTFRSGAVEQLRTHSRCLNVPLFEMGYSRDPSTVASAAKAYARENNYDCVLIDTAGRMQNNEPLMKALAKLVSDNTPDLVLFVGEALVGNDGIDQLSMFDAALKTYCSNGNNHGVTGIVLTKFDTIDDKVGAALSMSYKSGQPITFVGTGQKYTHLKRLNVNTVIHHLFST